MNVLFVSPYPPYPPTFGGSVRIFHLMRQTAKQHRVFSLSYESTLDRPVDRRPYLELCEDIVEVPRGKERKRARQLLSLASPRSFQRAVHRTAAMQAALERIVEQERIDVVVLEFAQMGCLDVPEGTAVVLDEHNVEWHLLRREREAAHTLLRRLYAGREWRKFRREEQASLTAADVVTVTSPNDREILLADQPELSVEVVPNGVDTDAFVPADGDGDASLLVFTGAMHYHPNTEAAVHFVTRILPRIAQRVPDVRFVAAGGKVPDELARLRSSRVEFTGYVDDITGWFARAAVFVVPLLVGGGTRFKVVEALSCRRPVVSTTLGAEGLGVVHDEHLLLADDPEAFADAVVHLLEDRAHARRLAAEGRRLVEQRFAWDVLGRRFLDALDAACEVRAARGASARRGARVGRVVA